MTKLVNRAKMTTATTGTGTITLGSAVDGFQSFADAGVANGNIVRYVIEDGNNWEIGLGTYSTTGTTLTRGSIESSNADNPINLTGNAVVFVSAAAADLQELVDFADNFVLPTADGSTGQVLTTNGAGTLSFTTISGYTNADVDAHLNTSTAASGEVLSWNGSDYDWVAAPAALTGQTDSASPFVTSLGVGAGAVSTGVNNTFVGFEAGNDVTSGYDNTAVGFRALDAATTGNRSVAIGSNALGSLTTGALSVAVGHNAGSSLTTGNFSTLVGWGAGSNATGGGNTALGYNSLAGDAVSKLTGNGNVAVGNNTGENMTSGRNNVLVGTEAGKALTSGIENFFGGDKAGLSATTANGNVGVGVEALRLLTSGYRNVAVGPYALDAATTALENVAVGSNAGGALTTGANNVAIGNGALDAATTGGRNIAIGQDAMGSGVATLSTGDNIAVGYQAGIAITSGAGNVFVGAQAGDATTTGSNQIVIGQGSDASSATVSNEITLGNSSITTLRCQVTTITSLSDARDKTDIQPLNAGLEFVEALNPVSFNWNMRDGGKVGVADTGFIAQDLQMAQEWAGVTIPGLVYDVNPDKLEAGYGKLIPVLVQAIKDLSAKVNLLEAQLEVQK